MNTTLDKSDDRSWDQASDNHAIGPRANGRYPHITARRLGRFMLASLLVQTIACVALDGQEGTHVGELLSDNGLTQEDLADSIPFSLALVDSALLDADGTSDQATGDQATGDQATGDQATGDQATIDQTTAGPLLATAHGQRFVRYAIHCALERGESVSNRGSGPDSFTGNLGLAPGWQLRGLTPGEKRALSACLLAHVNALGEEVAISIRNHDLMGLDPGESAEYEFHEATFYGDLFAPMPALYVCAGGVNDSATDNDRTRRVCSESVAPGSSETLCGFELTGSCADVCDTVMAGSYNDCWNSASRDGMVFSEAMSVWLSLDSGSGPR